MTKKPSKETSDKVSTDAGKLLAMAKRGRFVYVERLGSNMVQHTSATRLVKSVAACALTQDQTKGKRPKKARSRKTSARP